MSVSHKLLKEDTHESCLDARFVETHSIDLEDGLQFFPSSPKKDILLKTKVVKANVYHSPRTDIAEYEENRSNMSLICFGEPTNIGFPILKGM